jgi:hypothetical protein
LALFQLSSLGIQFVSQTAKIVGDGWRPLSQIPQSRGFFAQENDIFCHGTGANVSFYWSVSIFYRYILFANIFLLCTDISIYVIN